jgi:intein/homing endonuclease
MQKELTKMFITEKRPKSEILKVLGLTSNQYRYLLTKYNLHRKPVRTTSWFNHDFKNLTDEEIYILGFLWADGYLNGAGIKSNLQCEITYNDFKTIEDSFDKTGDWSRLYRKASIKNGVKRQKRVCLTISDRALIRKFIDFDFDKKGYINPIKILKLIPKNKHYLFYRGYVDGDGCFYITYNANQFSIGSTYNQDWTHIENLLKKLNIKNYSIQRRISNKRHKLSQIRVTSKESITKIVKYLYKDKQHIGLSRKLDKVKHLLRD